MDDSIRKSLIPGAKVVVTQQIGHRILNRAGILAAPFALRPPPAPGALSLVDSITLTTGGNVCNTGIAMAKLGMRVAASGMVGNDILGSAVREKLEIEGVDTSTIFESETAQTAATVVAVEPGGERVFFHTPGVTPLLD